MGMGSKGHLGPIQPGHNRGGESQPNPDSKAPIMRKLGGGGTCEEVIVVKADTCTCIQARSIDPTLTRQRNLCLVSKRRGG